MQYKRRMVREMKDMVQEFYNNMQKLRRELTRRHKKERKMFIDRKQNPNYTSVTSIKRNYTSVTSIKSILLNNLLEIKNKICPGTADEVVELETASRTCSKQEKRIDGELFPS